jgi:ribosomal-protein-alanine N-acetyltransferase
MTATEGPGATIGVRLRPLAIRPMTLDDVDAVAVVEQQVAPQPWSRRLFADEFTIDATARHWLVAALGGLGSGSGRVDGEEIIGFAGAMLVADEAHVMNIAVDPRHQRQGVARRLLARLLLDVGDRGAVTATLEVRPTNRAALALYRRFDFSPRGRRPGYYGDGSDALILTGSRLYRPDYRRLLESQAADRPDGGQP